MPHRYDPSDVRYQDRHQAAVELLKMWRNLVQEGGVPRYTVLPGAALNTLVTWTDAYLKHPALDIPKNGDVPAKG